MEISKELQTWIELNIDLLETENYKLIFKQADFCTLELINLLHEIKKHEFDSYLVNTKDADFFKSLIHSFISDLLGGGDYNEFMTSNGFRIERNDNLYIQLTFDPATRKWEVLESCMVYKGDAEYTITGQGWDNLVYNLADHSDQEYYSYFHGSFDSYDLDFYYINDFTRFSKKESDVQCDLFTDEEE